eukprot:2967122-Rhodomonas_salina.2
MESFQYQDVRASRRQIPSRHSRRQYYTARRTITGIPYLICGPSPYYFRDNYVPILFLVVVIRPWSVPDSA